MNLIKNIFLPIVIFLILFIVADNVYYGFNVYNPEKKNYVFSARHATNLDFTHSPPKHYQSISDADLWVEPVRFRTGELGETLPHGGEGNCKIFLLGGSTTETHWVPENLRWPYLVGEAEDIKSLATTYNFGVGGQNLHQSLQRYLTYLADAKPDIVIVNHFTNDLAKFIRGNYYSLESSSLHNTYDLHKQDNFRVRIRKIITNIFPFTYATWKQISNEVSNEPARVNKQIQNRAQKNPIIEDFENFANNYLARILALNSLVEAHGGKLVLIMQPHRYHSLLTTDSQSTSNSKVNLEKSLEKNSLSTDEFLTVVNRFKKFLLYESKKHDLELINTSALSDDTSYYYDAIHFTPQGSQAFADLLSSQLRPIINSTCPVS